MGSLFKAKSPILNEYRASTPIWWRGMDLNHGPSGYAYHYSFHCRTQLPFTVTFCGVLFTAIESFAGLDCPFTLVSGIEPLR